MRKKLTRTQKIKNEKKYQRIRKGFEQVKDKNTFITYKQFKNRVQAQMEVNPNLNLNKAIKKVQNTESFTSAAERSRTNLLEALKKDYNTEYKEIRNLSRDEKGHFKKLKLDWTKNGDKWGYSFVGLHGLTYFIDVTNSPEEVLVYAI